MSLVQEKVNQAVQILDEQEIDLWLTFVRETSAMRDPALDLLLGHMELTWPSALMFARTGGKVAIVGNLEKVSVERLEVYDTVLGYDSSIKEQLRALLSELDPQKIAINTSHNNVHADGLTHGMHELLQNLLEGTPYGSRLVSAEALIGALRGRKTEAEQARVRRAVEITDEIFRATFEHIRTGMTELELADFMQAEARRRGLELAWPAEVCPAVNSGPNSITGHTGPTDIRVEPGHILHFDFGIKYEEYCSDIQRVGYVLRKGETKAPQEVRHGFDTIRTSIEKARAAMRPGVTGNEIDVIARSVVTEAGYSSFPHALGHQLGRVAHDGGALLGPLWEKYGDAPRQKLEAGQIFTIEPSLSVAGYGQLSLEEDVIMTEAGAKYLAEPQTEIILIQG